MLLPAMVDLYSYLALILYVFIYANLAILATLRVLLVTRCMSWILGGLVAF